MVAPDVPPSDAPPVLPEPPPEPPAFAAALAPELVPALAPPKLAFEPPTPPPALAPPLLDPAAELPGAEVLGAPQAAIPAVMANVVKIATVVVREFFMCGSELDCNKFPSSAQAAHLFSMRASYGARTRAAKLAKAASEVSLIETSVIDSPSTPFGEPCEA